MRKLSPVNNNNIASDNEYWGKSKDEWLNGGHGTGTVNRKLRRMTRTTPESECDGSYIDDKGKASLSFFDIKTVPNLFSRFL